MSVAKESNCLLLCHDAFYSKTPAPLQTMRSTLQSFNEYAKINEVGHKPWAFHNTQSHEDHIEQEERTVAEYFRSQGLPALTDQQITKKMQWKKQRQQQVMRESYANENGRDFDNGVRLESRYDPDLDPFYMED
jgi:hypothetical protein